MKGKSSNKVGAQPYKPLWSDQIGKAASEVAAPKWSDFLGLQRRCEKQEGKIAFLFFLFVLMGVWSVCLTLIHMDAKQEFQSKMDDTLRSYGYTYHDQTGDINNIRRRLDHAVEVQDALFKHLGVEAFKPVNPPAEWKVEKSDRKKPRNPYGSVTDSDEISRIIREDGGWTSVYSFELR